MQKESSMQRECQEISAPMYHCLARLAGPTDAQSQSDNLLPGALATQLAHWKATENLWVACCSLAVYRNRYVCKYPHLVVHLWDNDSFISPSEWSTWRVPGRIAQRISTGKRRLCIP